MLKQDRIIMIITAPFVFVFAVSIIVFVSPLVLLSHGWEIWENKINEWFFNNEDEGGEE